MPPLDPSTLRAIYEHAQREYPRECCGYVRLDEGGLWSCVPCENQQDQLHALDPELHPRDATTAYHIGGAQLLGLARSLESEAPAKIIYHSHPEGGAYFSQTDAKGALASAYPVDYLVVDVAQGIAREAKCFTRQGEHFIESAHYDAQGRMTPASKS